MQDEGDLFNYKTYSAIDFVIGLFITLGASIVNALGLNITKFDFTRQEALPTSARRPDWKRGLWWLGLILYIASQLVGSTLALEYLRAEYVAPLGSTSLIFNFVFAYLLVGTPVTRTDIIGTVIIVLGVIGVVLFGNHRTATDFDKESNLSLSLLKQLWGRSDWIAYLTCLEATTLFSFWISIITHEVCMARVTDERGDADGEREMGMGTGGGGRRKVETGWRARLETLKKHRRIVRDWIKKTLESWSQSRPDSSIRKLAGLCWSITGGLLAGQTLVFAKSVVKLVSSAISKSDPNQANQFTSPLTWLIVILLVIAAVTQIWCLNASLKCYDSTFCVPIFFSTYTTCGFINSLVYLDELHTYKLWVFLCIWASIAVLVVGVVLLSTKKTTNRARAASMVVQDEAGAVGEGYDDISLTPTLVGGGRAGGGGANSSEDKNSETELKKGQGWLARFLPGGGGGGGGGVTRKTPGELEQGERRRQRGVQKLSDRDDGGDVDVDSVLGSEHTGIGAREVEMDEIDALEYHHHHDPRVGGRGVDSPGHRAVGSRDSGKVFDVADEEEEDEFGEFKQGGGAGSAKGN
ncbi:hypothetical protein T439DRAFT_327797 [Meredithblackwellia eburnea MCA 4105]